MRIPRRLALVVCFVLLLSSCASSPAPPLALDHSAAYDESAAPCSTDVVDVTWIDEARGREIPVRFRIPRCEGRHPLIVFSHGLANSRKGYEYAGQFWAEHGYVVAHVQHHGSDDELGPWALFRSSKNRKHWRDRPLDVRFVLDRLEQIDRAPGNGPEARLAGIIDFEHIGIGGHSYGAFTGLVITGMTIDLKEGRGVQSFADRRFDSVFAMSMPKMPEATLLHAYDAIRLPILHITGTRDLSHLFRTAPADRLIAYNEIKHAPQMMVVLRDAGHSSFSNDERRPSINRDVHIAAVQQLSLAFWDWTLRGNAKAREWLEKKAPEFLGRAAE